MKTKKLLATMAVSAILLTGCSFGQKDTIIKVNDKNISKSEFETVFERTAQNSMFAKMGIDVQKDKSGFIYLMLKDRVINELVIKSLLDEEIKKRGITVSKAELNEEIKTIIDKFGSKEKFNEILKQNGISAKQFQKDLSEEIKMKKLVASIKKIDISDADIEKFYKENKDKFKYPEKVRASHILISANPEEIREEIVTDEANNELSSEEIQVKVDKILAEKKSRAKKLLAEVKKDKESFAKFAKENSDDRISAEQGGDLGFFDRKEMVDQFTEVAFSIKPNKISEIVTTPYGYHIILVKDRTEAGVEPLEKVRGEIQNYLEGQEQVTVLEELIESLKKQAKIEYVNPEYSPANIQEQITKQAEARKEAQKAKMEAKLKAEDSDDVDDSKDEESDD